MHSNILEPIAKVTDSEILNRVNPKDLENYLVARKWKPHYDMPGEWRTLRKRTKHGEYEIVIPLDRTYADYTQRIYDAISTIGKIEQRSQMYVLEDLGVLPSNVIYRIADEANSIAKAGGTPKKVYLDNAALWSFGKLPESQTGIKFQQVLAEKGPRAALEKVFGGQVSGLKIVFDADRFRVE